MRLCFTTKEFALISAIVEKFDEKEELNRLSLYCTSVWTRI